MITMHEVWVILGALVIVGLVYGLIKSTLNWFAAPIISILINNAPLVIYVRVFGITICRIGKPDYYNEWNTFLFSLYFNFYLTIKWSIYDHQLNKMWLLKTELKSLLRKIVFGKKKTFYKRDRGAKAILVHIKDYSTYGDYFVSGTRTVKQRFKKTVHETGYLLIGECEFIMGKAFMAVASEEELVVKMTETHRNIASLYNSASRLTAMTNALNAKMKNAAYEGRVVDM